MGPSVIINTFIFYNYCFLHARTSSLPGPQGPGRHHCLPPNTHTPTPRGKRSGFVCWSQTHNLPNASRLLFVPRGGGRNQTRSRPCVQHSGDTNEQVTFQTVSKRALDPETSKLQWFHCLNQPSEKTHVCTI